MSGKNISGVVAATHTGILSSGTQQTKLYSTTVLGGTGGVLLGLLCGCLIGRLIAKVYFLQHRSSDRRLAVQQSKATTLGYVSEKVAPLLPDFPYSYKDLVFLGKGVDYICFDGLSEGAIQQIVFIEIKTGKSQLNKNEMLIRQAIEKGKVTWETIRI